MAVYLFSEYGQMGYYYWGRRSSDNSIIWHTFPLYVMQLGSRFTRDVFGSTYIQPCCIMLKMLNSPCRCPVPCLCVERFSENSHSLCATMTELSYLPPGLLSLSLPYFFCCIAHMHYNSATRDIPSGTVIQCCSCNIGDGGSGDCSHWLAP